MSDEKKRTLKNKGPNESQRNQYHPALCNAMEIGLFSDRELLEFLQSIKMNTLPREIDFLVIRKKKEGTLKNEIARFFRKCNIWEFKGYGGKLDIQVFHKTMSYAYEYLALNKEIGSITDMTLSFLREGKPRELMKWLGQEGFVKKDFPGWINRFEKDGYPGVQIVNIAHDDAPAFLKVVSHRVKTEDIRNFANYVAGLPEEERDKARLVVELSYRINGDKKGGDDMAGFFETYVDPLNKVIEEKDAEIKQKDNQIIKVIEEKEEEIKQKDSQISKVIEEKNAEIKKKDSEMKKVIKERDAEIKEKNEIMEKMKAEIIRLGGNAAVF